MTWIKLHSYGKECWCDFPNHIHLERNAEGGTCVFRSGTGSYDETPEQIIALIADAEREPPKIDAQRVWELCAALHAQAELLGSCSITSPARIHMQKRIDEMRADIKKELGL